MEEPKSRYKEIEKLKLKEFPDEVPKAYKKICCPSCNETVVAENLNLLNQVAKCGACHVIFSIADDVERLSDKKEVKHEVIRPEGIELFRYKNELDISVQQNLQVLDGVGLGIFPALAPFSFFVCLNKGYSLLFPMIFTALAIYFVYRLSQYKKFKTHIDINDQYLSIKWRPNNFHKDRVYDVSDIDQLYLKTDPSGYFGVYMIVNSVDGQKHEKLVAVKSLSKAKYLEQEIERYMNIEDRKVLEANL